MNKNITIEICCGSYEDVLASKEAGAHRAELNSALFLGGLTPSLGAFLLAKQVEGIQILPMVRPRQAGFFYNDAEYETMVRDAKLFVEHGAEGIVFGFLNADGTVDEGRTAEFVKLTGEGDAVFHRAFDLTPDPFAAMETLINCGVKRILTSGQAPSVPEGLELIKELVERAKGRIEILPGAGIRPTNVAKIVEYTGVNQLHFSAMTQRHEPSNLHNPSLTFGGALRIREDLVDVISAGKITQVTEALNAYRG
ncbi:MAG: copper homeostasis protein CutC [Defluviitaleaceae bacterium]|nr:copper homeostasis protein CutC [Defluviitaleaceae bacterium]